MKRFEELVNTNRKGKKELAEFVNIPVTLVYKWLNNETNPSFKNLILIADFYEISVDYLVGRTEDDSSVKTKNLIPFDENVKTILKTKHITKYRMFKDCGFSDGHEFSWFTLKNLPRYDNLIKMADYLNVSMDELMGRVI